MQGLTTILLEDYGKAFDETGKGYAERIIAAASRMDHLIQDLLSYGRLGHVEVPLGVVNLNVTVQASLATLSRELGINPKTVAKWRKRAYVADARMGPKESHSTVDARKKKQQLWRSGV